MNINSVSSTDQLSALGSVSDQTTTNSPSSLPPPGAGIGDAAVPHMSGPGKLMSKLAALKQADPDKFQATVSDMASKLKDAAAQATGPQAQLLTNLSNKLSDIANGGDISELKGGGAPGGGQASGAQGVHHGGHHHHHGGGGGLGGVGSSSTSSDSSENSVQSVAQSVFGELDAALNSATSSNSTSGTSST